MSQPMPRKATKRVHSTSLPLACWPLVFLMGLMACGSPSEPARVEIHIPAATDMPAWATQDFSASDQHEPGAEWFRLQINALDFDAPMSVTGMVGATIRLDVPAGKNREFRVELFHRPEMELATHRGTAPGVTLVSGTPTRVRIDVRSVYHAPTVGSVSLNEGPVFTTDTLEAEARELADPLDRPVTLQYAWLNGEEVIEGAEDRVLPGTFVAKGEQIRVRVTPVAGDDVGEAITSEAVTILNSPPVVGSLGIEEGPRNRASGLFASTVATDADDDALTYTYTWYVDGFPVEGVTGPELSGDHFIRDDPVWLSVVVSDGEASDSMATDTAVVVQNSPPVIDTVWFSKDEPFFTDSDLAVGVNWQADLDGDPVSFTYEWFVEGNTEPTVVIAEGPDYMAVDPFTFSKGQVVYARVTPFDGYDEGQSMETQSVTIQNSPPSIDEVALSEGPIRRDDLVTATVQGPFDLDGDDLTYTFEWFLAGSLNFTDSGDSQVQNTFGNPKEKGQELYVRVTPFDGDDEGMPVYSQTITVQNTPPVIHDLFFYEDGPYFTDSSLEVDYSWTDVDGDEPTFTFEWYVVGVTEPAFTVSNDGSRAGLDASYFSRGQDVFVRAIAFDGTDYSEPAETGVITIQNSPPGAPEIALTPERPTVWSTSLEVAIVSESEDADGDEPITYSYEWFRNGTPLAVTSGAVLSLGDLPGDLLAAEFFKVVVTPNDGYEDGVTAFAEVMIDTEGSVSLGHWHSCGLIGGITPLCWAQNLHGELGGGFTSTTEPPLYVLDDIGEPLADATLFAVGAYLAGQDDSRGHSCAVLRDTTIQCWGSNSAGQLGDGTSIDSLTPVTVMLDAVTPLTGATMVVAGKGYTCALLDTGNIKCWGHNFWGQLGDGTKTTRLEPVFVVDAASNPITGATTLSSFKRHTCALLEHNGRVLCWGANWKGRLGDNTTTDREYAITVSDSTGAAPLEGVKEIHVGLRTSCATMPDATAWCWGENDRGQLGDGSTVDRHLPVQVLASAETPLTGIRSVHPAHWHSCAHMENGGAKCWGYQRRGMLGNGIEATSNELYPVDVLEEPAGVPLSGVLGLTMGRFHACAITKTDPLLCWGDNTNEQLGDGTTTHRSTPVPILMP